MTESVEQAAPGTRTTCPRCHRRLVVKRDGIFQWRACPAVKVCGWTVFTHGNDPRDGAV